MNEEMDIGPALIDAVHSITRGHVIVEGTVQAVDQEAFTADILVGDSTFFAVPLKVLVGNQASVIEIPVVGTSVLMTFRDGNIQRQQIYMTHEVDKYLIDCNQVVYNGGKLGGLVNIEELVTRLNIVEQDLNTLKTAFAAWVVVPSDGGAALKAIAATWYAQQLTPTVRGDMEDQTITH
jgi:hypothetical protein